MKKAIPFEHYTHPEGSHPEGLPAPQKSVDREPLGFLTSNLKGPDKK